MLQEWKIQEKICRVMPKRRRVSYTKIDLGVHKLKVKIMRQRNYGGSSGKERRNPTKS